MPDRPIHLWQTRQPYTPHRSKPVCPFDLARLALLPASPGSRHHHWVCPRCAAHWTTSGLQLLTYRRRTSADGPAGNR